MFTSFVNNSKSSVLCERISNTTRNMNIEWDHYDFRFYAMALHITNKIIIYSQ